MKIAPFAIACLFMFAGFQSSLDGFDPYLEYDLEEMNEFWNSYEDHSYPKRTYPNQQSVEIADKIISNDEMPFLLNHHDPVVIPKSSIDWSENPFDFWTWQFYYHLKMVSYLVSSYEFTGDTSYLQEAKWYIAGLNIIQVQESRLVKERGMTTVLQMNPKFHSILGKLSRFSNCR